MMTYEAAKQLFDGAGLPLTESHFAQFQYYLAELTERSCPAGMEQDAVLQLLYYAFLVMDRGILPPKLISRIFELSFCS